MPPPIPMPPIIIPHPMPLAWASSMCFSIWSWWSTMVCHMSVFACQRAFHRHCYGGNVGLHLVKSGMHFLRIRLHGCDVFLAHRLHLLMPLSPLAPRTPGAGGVPACAPLEDCWPDGAFWAKAKEVSINNKIGNSLLRFMAFLPFNPLDLQNSSKSRIIICPHSLLGCRTRIHLPRSR